MTRKALTLVLALATTAALTVPALGSATKGVRIHKSAFAPAKLKIQKGTKVTWTWDGDAPHNVVVLQGPSKFHSKVKVTGTYSHVFKKKGKYTLVCTVHGFTMTVKVS